MSSKRLIRRVLAVFALATAVALLQVEVSAQNLPPPGAYQPIPNFTGVGAGVQFRQAINDRFSGVQPVSPAIASIAFASMPAEVDGMIVFCKDCKRATPCMAGGGGAWALGARGQWSCSTASLEANLSANGNKVTNLASATASGDALGYGQTAGGDLSGGLPNAIVQTVLNGKTPVFSGQTNPQFQTFAQPFVVGSTTAGAGPTSVTINEPAGTAQGDLEVFYVSMNSSSLTVTPPDGTWHLIKSGTSGSTTDASYYKVAGSSEASSYTFGISPSSFGSSNLIAVRNENQSSPIDASSYYYAPSSTTGVTIPSPSTSQSPDLTLILDSGFDFAADSILLGSPSASQLFLGFTSPIGTGVWYYTTSPTAAVLTNSTSDLWATQQISIAPVTFGPAAALINGQPEGALVSPAFSGTTVLASATLSGSIVGSAIGASASRLNLNGVYNVQNYGAKGDGVATCDDVGEQAAIDAACAVINQPPATVYWPTPIDFYDNCAPLFVHCSGIKLQGPAMGSGGTFPLIVQDSTHASGPMLVMQQLNMPGVSLGAPLISGSTNSASFTGVTNSYYVNLCDAGSVCWNTFSTGLNGSSAATIDAYVKLTSTAAGNIVCSNGSDAGSSTTYAYCLGINGSARFYAFMTVNGTTYTLTDTTTTLAAATLYDEQLTYDGTTIRLFTNGSLVASSAHSGTITQPYYETATVGGGSFPNGFPESGAFNINGLIDGVSISNVARHTSNFTPCNCEPTLDSNTLVIASFDQNLHMLTQLQWYGAGDHSTWSYTRNFRGGGVGSNEFDGLSFYGRQGSIGLIGQGFLGNHFRHLTFTNMLSGIWEYGTDFENTWDDIYSNATYIPFFMGGQSGLQYLTGGIQLVGGIVGFRSSGNSVVADGLVVQSQSSNIWNFDITGDTGDGYFDCFGCGADVENCGSNYRGSLDLEGVETTSWTGGALAACPGTPAVEIDGGAFSGDSVFSGVNWGPAFNSPEIIDMVNSPAGEARIVAPFLADDIQWSNSPANVSVEPCKGNVTLSGGSGFFSNICLTNGVPKCVDTTTGTNTVACGPISAGRQVTDGVTTSTSTTVTSATASFAAGDVGRKIEGGNMPANTTITAVGSSTSITISHAATASGTGVTLTFDGVVPLTGTGSDVIRINAE
jgi:hypothetical protein